MEYKKIVEECLESVGMKLENAEELPQVLRSLVKELQETPRILTVSFTKRGDIRELNVTPAAEGNTPQSYASVARMALNLANVFQNEALGVKQSDSNIEKEGVG